MNSHNDGFDEIISQEYADPAPYGIPAQPVKPGLTKRGKAGITIAAAVIAGGGLLFYQHYSAQQAANEAKTQELQIRREQIELEKLKEMNKVQAVNAKTQSTQNAALQRQIDACVNTNKGLVGKQLGANLRSVIEDCQAQYGGTNTGDMKTAASTQDAPTSGGGGVNNGLLIGGAVLAGGLVVAVKKGTRSNAA